MRTFGSPDTFIIQSVHPTSLLYIAVLVHVSCSSQTCQMCPDVAPTHQDCIKALLCPVFEPQQQLNPVFGPLCRLDVPWCVLQIAQACNNLVCFLQTEISELQQLLSSKDAEIEGLQNQLLSRGNTSIDGMERGKLGVCAENVTQLTRH